MAGISLQPPTAFRHEKKHQINLREDLVLSCRLRKLFAHDSHAGEDGSYRVTSLYFDTPYDDALRDKKNGVSQREKFRLRYYGKAPDAVRVEKRVKTGRCAPSEAPGLPWSRRACCCRGIPGSCWNPKILCCWNFTARSSGGSGRRPLSDTTGKPFCIDRAMYGSRWTAILRQALGISIF